MSKLEGWKGVFIDFGLPALVIIISGMLLMTGRDHEVKTILAMAAGWLFKSGYTRKNKGK